MIEKILAHSRTTETDVVTTRVVTTYNNSNLQKDSYLSSIFTSLNTVSVKLSEAVIRIKNESEVEDKDHTRDNNVRSFFYLITGFAHHPDEAIKTSAQILLNIFNNYGLEMINKSYGVETSLVNSLLIELDKPENAEYINLLSGAAESIAAIKSSQNDFETYYLNFEKEKAKASSVDSASQLKKEVLQIINGMLVPYLNGMVSVDKAKYGEFAQIINQIISNNNMNVKKRSKTTVVNSAVLE